MSSKIIRSVLLSVAAFAANLVLVSTVHGLTLTVAPNGNIQAAIDQVAAAGGGTVNITSGQGTLTTPLRMKSKVALNGAGTPATTLGVGGNFTGIQNDTEGLTNVTIQNLKLAGNGETTSTNCNGIIISSLGTYHKTVKVSNVQVLTCGGMGIHIKRANGINVLNSNIHDNGGFTLMHNMYIRESTGASVTGTQLNGSKSGTGLHVAGICSSFTIKQNTLSNNGSQGMNIQDSPDIITIQGNTANGNGVTDATRADGIAFTGTNALIDSNTCNSNVGNGIHTWSGNGSVTNNNATGNAAGDYDIHGTFTQSNNQ